LNEIKKMWMNLERTVVKPGRTDENGHHFADGDDKGRQFFFQ